MVIPKSEAHAYDITSQHISLDKATNPKAPYSGVTVKLQAQHMLHCVNLLRQGLWYNQPYYASTNHPSWDAHSQVMYGNYSLVELHTAHCVDQLRQLVMCDVDLRVLPFMESKEGGEVVMDFARPKQCRNYKSMLDWHGERKWEAAKLMNDEDVPGHEIPYYSWSGRD